MSGRHTDQMKISQDRLTLTGLDAKRHQLVLPPPVEIVGTVQLTALMGAEKLHRQVTLNLWSTGELSWKEA